MGIFSPGLDWAFSLRLPDFTTSFHAEYLAIVLALRKLHSDTNHAIVLTDSLSVCTALSGSKSSPLRRALGYLLPPSLQKLRLVWVPGHAGIWLNEAADTLAGIAVDGPVMEVLPPINFVTSARFRRLGLLQSMEDSAYASYDLEHLRHSWKCRISQSRACEVTLTSFRCGVPNLNYYLYRCNLAPSPLCAFCNELETAEHFFLSCRRYSSIRKRYLENSFNKLAFPLSVPLILSFGAKALGFSRADLCSAVHLFISESGRLPC